MIAPTTTILAWLLLCAGCGQALRFCVGRLARFGRHQPVRTATPYSASACSTLGTPGAFAVSGVVSSFRTTSSASSAPPIFLALIVLAGVMCYAPGAHAKGCTVTPPVVAFPAYNPLSVYSATTIGQMKVDCAPPNPDSKGFSAVAVVSLLSGGATGGQRSMVGSRGGSLSYNLYLDPALTNVFGDGSSGTKSVTICQGTLCPSGGGTVSDQPVLIPVYGAIPPRQDVLPGTYTDTVTILIVF